MKLIVDASVLVGELSRRRGQELIRHPELTLYVAERALDETYYELTKRITAAVERGRYTKVTGEDILQSARQCLDNHITFVAGSVYARFESEARARIPRDPNDWPTVAAALALEAAIWTQDPDFLGCGCPTWTTETLLIRLNRIQ
jgi:predicted nucleic acid-binding protein